MNDLPNDAVAAGTAAWGRLKENNRTAFADWVAVARSIKVLRDAALKAAGIDKPYGKIYSRHMAESLRQHGLDDVAVQVRSNLMQLLEQLPEIERWRAGLDPARRRDLNHPDANLLHYRNSVRVRQETRTRMLGAKGPRSSDYRYHHHVSFTQDMVRRAGMAMRANWCNDVFKLAAIALSAAIRNEDDLQELLPAAPVANAPKPRAVETVAPDHAPA
jgi:hypothetical protein